MKRAILVFILLFCSIPATAADKWTRVQSKNFTLAGNATENEIREVAEALEVFRTAFARFFKLNLQEGSSVGTTVIVFRSDDAFKPFKPVYNGEPRNVAGYFQQGQNTGDAEPPVVRRATPTEPAPAPEFTREERDKLQKELDDLAPGTAKMRGVLTLLDCRNGMTLSLVVEGKIAKFHTATPNTLKFTSFNSAVTGQIACGPTPGNGVPAAIVYRPKESADGIGEPLSVEFLDTTDRSVALSLPVIPGTSTVKGLLTKLDCTGSVSISVASEGKTLQFYADSTSKVAFMNGTNPDGTVTCGPIAAPGLPVTVLYRPAASGSIAGEPVIVQFQK